MPSNEYQSDCPEYRTVANSVNFAINQLRNAKKQRGLSSSRRLVMIDKIHTLMVTKWIAAKRFNIQLATIGNDLKTYHKAAHANVVDELFFLKHYRYSIDDLHKYKQQFKEELNYEMEII